MIERSIQSGSVARRCASLRRVTPVARAGRRDARQLCFGAAPDAPYGAARVGALTDRLLSSAAAISKLVAWKICVGLARGAHICARSSSNLDFRLSRPRSTTAAIFNPLLTDRLPASHPQCILEQSPSHFGVSVARENQKRIEQHLDNSQLQGTTPKGVGSAHVAGSGLLEGSKGSTNAACSASTSLFPMMMTFNSISSLWLKEIQVY